MVILVPLALWARKTVETLRSQPRPPGLTGALFPPAGSELSRRMSLLVPASVAVAWNVLAVFRDGANKNTLLEGYISLGTCTVVLVLDHLPRKVGKPMAAWPGFTGLLLLASCVFPAAQLVFFNQLGDLTNGSDEDYQRLVAFGKFVETLPKPLFVDHSIFGQPWRATNGKYPAFLVDFYWYNAAKHKGWIQNGGFESLVRKRQFRCLLLNTGPISKEAALEAGYRPSPIAPGIDPLGFHLFVLPEDTAAQGQFPGTADSAKP
jgi:hypothetical protein